jgi:FkbM family methyltransferase
MLTAEALGEIFDVRDPDQRFRKVLAHLDANDVVIDCGANVGVVSKKFAAKGCQVHAFEPDPVALTFLRERLKDSPNVVIHAAAVGVSAGRAKLYFHRHRQDVHNDVELTQSSSLVADKKNVSVEDYAEVPVVDLGDFIVTLPKRVAVLKVDVEGGEGELLEMIFERRLYERFDVAFFETHEAKVPSIRPAMARVRGLIEQLGIRNIFLDWK